MAVLIMMNAFTSLFKTALMIKGPDDTMYTIKDLSDRPDLTVFFRPGGFEEKFFKVRACKLVKIYYREFRTST